MGNYIIKLFGGDSFESASAKAKKVAQNKKLIVEFEFNGVRCLVSQRTNLDWLYRDYSNSWTMEWKTVGPECRSVYDSDVQEELEKRNKAREEKIAIQQAEYKAKDERERLAFEEKTKGIEIELKDAEKWKNAVDINTDPYGKCCIDYAEGWAKLMQIEIAYGQTVVECADKTSHELSFYGITGFMYGAAVSTLSACWKHGEELRKWHNRQYKHEGDGVVNPAIISVKL